MPIAANCHGRPAAKTPWLAADAARMPSRKAPLTLTTTVPQGNVSPTRRATKPDSQNLAVPPSTLPSATHMTPLIVSTVGLYFSPGHVLLKSSADRSATPTTTAPAVGPPSLVGRRRSNPLSR